MTGPSASYSGLVKASIAFMSFPMTVNYAGRWRMSTGSVSAFTTLMKVAKLNWQNFKGPTQSSVIVHVRPWAGRRVRA